MSNTPAKFEDGDPRNGVQRSLDAVKEELSEVRETAGDIRERLKEAGAKAMSGVADKIRTEASAKVDDASGSFNRLATELDRVATNCSDNEKWAAKLFSAGASSLKSASDYLSTRRLDDFVREGEDFARRNPVAFVGATIAAGFLLSRIGKTAAIRAAELARRDDVAARAPDFREDFDRNYNPSSVG